MITIEFTYTTEKIELKIWGVDLKEHFPKSYKVYCSKCWGYNGMPWSEYEIFTYICANLESDSVNKGKNEIGLERIAKFIKKIRKIDDIEFVENAWNKTYKNGVHSLPESLLGISEGVR